VDDKGNIVPSADGLEIKFSITGNAGIVALGNGNPADMSSFQQDHKMVFGGKALAIIRPKGIKGSATLTAKAEGLKAGIIQITIK